MEKLQYSAECPMMDIDHVGGPGGNTRQRARGGQRRVGLETDPAAGKLQFGDNVVVAVYDDLNSVTRDDGRGGWVYLWKTQSDVEGSETESSTDDAYLEFFREL